MTPELPSWPATLQALTIVMNPRLELQYKLFISINNFFLQKLSGSSNHVIRHYFDSTPLKIMVNIHMNIFVAFAYVWKWSNNV